MTPTSSVPSRLVVGPTEISASYYKSVVNVSVPLRFISGNNRMAVKALEVSGSAAHPP